MSKEDLQERGCQKNGKYKRRITNIERKEERKNKRRIKNIERQKEKKYTIRIKIQKDRKRENRNIDKTQLANPQGKNKSCFTITEQKINTFFQKPSEPNIK